MGTLDIDALEGIVKQGMALRKLLKESPELMEFLKLVKDTGKDLAVVPARADPYIEVGAAAKVLGTTKNRLYELVKQGYLSPYYLPGGQQMKFRLSEVEALPERRDQNDTNGEEAAEKSAG